jgi:hypothetical protein
MKKLTQHLLTGVVLASAVIGTNTLANEQVVSLDSSIQGIYPGESFDVLVNYSVTNQVSVSGLGIQIFFDSSALTLAPVTEVFGDGKIAQAIQDDNDNLDNDPTTDSYVNISWMSFSGQWPMQMPESLELARLSFTSEEDFTGALIHVGKSSNAAGYEFVGQSLYISAN